MRSDDQNLTIGKTLSVSEIFGPTIQGEGRSQGKPVVFLRLGLCNLDCSWCDTPFTWDWTGKNGKVYEKEQELRTMTIDEIFKDLKFIAAGHTDRLVISGGEPLLQQRRLLPLIRRWMITGAVEIETNGTIIPHLELAEMGVQFNCSPKLSNSGIDMAKRIDEEVLTVLSDYEADFKFVVSSEEDLDEIDWIVDQYIKPFDRSKIYLMPEGISREAILKNLPWVMNRASSLGYSVSPRLHVLAYGNERGK